VARYFDRAWLIYRGAETGVYADLVSRRGLRGAISWHGTVVGAVNWATFLDERVELDLRTLSGEIGRFRVTRHDTSSERAEITGHGPPPF
jgi:hypothetical protein